MVYTEWPRVLLMAQRSSTIDLKVATVQLDFWIYACAGTRLHLDVCDQQCLWEWLHPVISTGFCGPNNISAVKLLQNWGPFYWEYPAIFCLMWWLSNLEICSFHDQRQPRQPRSGSKAEYLVGIVAGSSGATAVTRITSDLCKWCYDTYNHVWKYLQYLSMICKYDMYIYMKYLTMHLESWIFRAYFLQTHRWQKQNPVRWLRWYPLVLDPIEILEH